ncbi:hypothetical protein HK102_006804 [Quaeritorhiza haematococci]|nr:hypothetical protein HK102_006804 [Quaeritorhiza haematococci]
MAEILYTIQQNAQESALALMLKQLPVVITKFEIRTEGNPHQLDFLQHLIAAVRLTDLHTLKACLGDSSNSDVTVDNMVKFFEALAVQNTVQWVELQEQFRVGVGGVLRLRGQLDDQHRLRTVFEQLTRLEVFFWNNFCVEPIDTFFHALTACSSLMRIGVVLGQDLPCTHLVVEFLQWCLSSDSKMVNLTVDYIRGFSLRFGAITFDHLDFQVFEAWNKAVTSSSLELQFGRVDFPRTSWSTESAVNLRTNDYMWKGICTEMAGVFKTYRKNRADSARAMLKLGRYFAWSTKAKLPREVLLRILEYIASHLVRDEFGAIVKALSFGSDVATGTVGSAGVGRFLNMIDGIIQQNTYTLAMQLALNCRRVYPK